MKMKKSCCKNDGDGGGGTRKSCCWTRASGDSVPHDTDGDGDDARHSEHGDC